MIINVNYPHSCFCYSQCSLLTVFTCSSSFWFPQELYHGESPFHLYLVQRCCGNTKHAFCNTGYVLCMLFYQCFMMCCSNTLSLERSLDTTWIIGTFSNLFILSKSLKSLLQSTPTIQQENRMFSFGTHPLLTVSYQWGAIV